MTYYTLHDIISFLKEVPPYVLAPYDVRLNNVQFSDVDAQEDESPLFQFHTDMQNRAWNNVTLSESQQLINDKSTVFVLYKKLKALENHQHSLKQITVTFIDNTTKLNRLIKKMIITHSPGSDEQKLCFQTNSVIWSCTVLNPYRVLNKISQDLATARAASGGLTAPVLTLTIVLNVLENYADELKKLDCKVTIWQVGHKILCKRSLDKVHVFEVVPLFFENEKDITILLASDFKTSPIPEHNAIWKRCNWTPEIFKLYYDDAITKKDVLRMMNTLKLDNAHKQQALKHQQSSERDIIKKLAQALKDF